MLQTIINFLQEIGNRLSSLWEAGKQLFQIVDSVFSSLSDLLSSVRDSISVSGNAMIPGPLIWVVGCSLVIFVLKVILGSSSNG